MCDAGVIGLSLAILVLLCADVAYRGTPLHFDFEAEFNLVAEHNRERLMLGHSIDRQKVTQPPIELGTEAADLAPADAGCSSPAPGRPRRG
ncbi:MAG: hypothetical protein ACJ8H8_31220 [Geminicoccaceae bacterium]|jgi:hypothetical protein